MLDGTRHVHDVLAASLICVSGQIAWVDRRANGAGLWHECVREGLAVSPKTGWGNLLTLDERLAKLKSNVYHWRKRE